MKAGELVSSPTQFSNLIYCARVCARALLPYTLLFSKGWADQLDTPVSLIKWSPEFSRQLLPTSSRRAKYWRNSKTGFCLSIDSSRLTWKHHLQSVNCSTSVCLSYNINYHAGLCYFACSEDQTVVGSAKGQHMLSSYTCHNSFKSQFFLFSHRTVHVLRLINKLHW